MNLGSPEGESHGGGGMHIGRAAVSCVGKNHRPQGRGHPPLNPPCVQQCSLLPISSHTLPKQSHLLDFLGTQFPETRLTRPGNLPSLSVPENI